MASIQLALTYSVRQVAVGDPGRIAGEMISGIGFLGAGAIIQSRGSVHGLTTAATIWFLAGVGLAIGSGYYAPAIVTTVILLAILSALGWFEKRMSKPRHFAHYTVKAQREAGVLDAINEIADEAGLSLESFELARKGEGMEIQFAVTCPTETRDALIEELLEIEAVEGVSVNA